MPEIGKIKGQLPTQENLYYVETDAKTVLVFPFSYMYVCFAIKFWFKFGFYFVPKIRTCYVMIPPNTKKKSSLP